MKTNDTIDTYKVRLVVKGFKQQEGVNCVNTYLFVSRITFIWTLIVIATINKL
jgi:hypothetical protein